MSLPDPQEATPSALYSGSEQHSRGKPGKEEAPSNQGDIKAKEEEPDEPFDEDSTLLGEAVPIEQLHRLQQKLGEKHAQLNEVEQELEHVKGENLRKTQELQLITQSLAPLMDSLHNVQKQLDERDANDSADKEETARRIQELTEQLQEARLEITKKDLLVVQLQQENENLKRIIDSTQKGDTSDIEEKPASSADTSTHTDSNVSIDSKEKAPEGTNDEDPNNSSLDQLKTMLEREFDKLNSELKTAEQFSESFRKKTRAFETNIERMTVDIAASADAVPTTVATAAAPPAPGAAGNEKSEDPALERRLKLMPREVLEKQVRHLHEVINQERATNQTLIDEKSEIEEELMQVKLELEQKQLEVTTLQSGKEQLELYVAKLAEDMEQETSQMVSMKEIFQTEAQIFTDTSYLSDEEGQEDNGAGVGGHAPETGAKPSPRKANKVAPANKRRSRIASSEIDFDVHRYLASDYDSNDYDGEDDEGEYTSSPSREASMSNSAATLPSPPAAGVESPQDGEGESISRTSSSSSVSARPRSVPADGLKQRGIGDSAEVYINGHNPVSEAAPEHAHRVRHHHDSGGYTSGSDDERVRKYKEEIVRLKVELHRARDELKAPETAAAHTTASTSTPPVSVSQGTQAPSASASTTEDTAAAVERLLVSEMRAQLSEKERELETLRKDLKASRSAYEEYARKQQELEKEGISSVQEVEGLKKELFFSLAVAIKLNLTLQGKRCNLSVMALYDKASKEGVHHSRWNEWIPIQLEASATPEALPFRLLRNITGGGSSSSSSASSASSNTSRNKGFW